MNAALLLLSGWFSIALTLNTAAVTISAGVHLINSDLNDDLEITGDAVVTFAPGAKASNITVSGNAELHMTGGELGGSIIAKGGRSYLSGGIVNTSNFLTAGVSADGGYVRFEGLSVPVASASEFSIIDFYSGGADAAIWAYANGTINIFGGNLDVKYGIQTAGEINIYGGRFSSGLYVVDSSVSAGVLNIYGTSFDQPAGVLSKETDLVSGVLADGSAFSLEIHDSVWNSRDTTVRLILVPEPGAMLMGMAGLMPLLAARRRGKL